MSAHTVFVRFFFGYSDSFPYERFVHLKDDDCAGAIEALGEEWWSKQRRERFELSGDFLRGITRRYPVARFDTKRRADDAAAALQARVSELARSAYAKPHWNDEDFFLTVANPRFIVVADTELTGSELATTREKVQRITKPAGEHQSSEEGLTRFYLPKISGTLEQFRDAESATSDIGKSQPTTGAAARESLVLQPAQGAPDAMARPATASTTAPAQEIANLAIRANRRKRMTIAQADAEANRLHSKDRKEFIGLSHRKQAKRIGCSFATWMKTDLFKELYPHHNPPRECRIPASKVAVNLVDPKDGLCEGRPDEVLLQLIEEEDRVKPTGHERELAEAISDQKADFEPSPLVEDDRGQPRKVKAFKRV